MSLKNYTDIVSPILDFGKAQPNSIAFVANQSKITYRRFVESILKTAQCLKDNGVGIGDRVAMLSGNRADVMVYYLATASIGGIFVPVNSDYSSKEVNYIVGHAEPKLVIVENDLADKYSKSVSSMEKRPFYMTLEECSNGAHSAKPIPESEVICDEDSLVLICYTSGTTSTPKGVPVTHRNEIAAAAAYGEMWAVSEADRFLVALPLTFAYGLCAVAYVALSHGATSILLPKFHPRRVLEAIEEFRPTIFPGVPTMYAMMADFAKDQDYRFDASSLRLTLSSGAALTEQVKEDCKKLFDIEVLNYYAMTEIRPIFCFDLTRRMFPPKGSVGCLILPTEVRIVGDDGNEVSSGEVGELFVKGPSFYGEYYKDAARTKDVIVDGWFKTGDLVSVDEKGFYYIVGRIREQIICGGAKIAPIEVEEILIKHPGVLGVAVIGSPDATFGEIVKAVIVKQDPSLSEEDVVSYCENFLASYKVPKVVEFISELPVGSSGKVLKSALK